MPAFRSIASWGLSLLTATALAALTASNLAARPDLARAEEAHRHKNTTKTLAAALDELAEHPRDADAARLAALSLSALIYAEKAEPYYDIARSRGRLTLEDLHVRALGLARSNRREKALEAYREILERNPTDTLALQRASTLEWTGGELYKAYELASRLAKTDEGAIAGLTLQGTLHHEAKHSLEALPFYEEVLTRDPQLQRLPIDESVFWKEYCEDLLLNSRAPEARRHLLAVCERLDSSILYNLLGRAHEVMGDIPAAEEAWRHANRLDPSAPQPLKNLGRLAMQRGSLEEADRLLRGSYRLAPKGYEINYLMSVLANREGRLDESKEFQRRAREIRRQDQEEEAKATAVPKPSFPAEASASPQPPSAH